VFSALSTRTRNVRQRRLAWWSGAIAAFVFMAALAEVFLRFYPPADIYPWLGRRSPLSGPFAPDSDFTVGYRSWQAFHDANQSALSQYLPFGRDTRPVWAFFGNSFVHMPGMLADAARQRVRDRVIFNLGRNELLPVRLAQIKLLLESGLRPERIFVAVMPVDVEPLARQPLDTYRVTSRGAITFDPGWPEGGFGRLVRASALGRTAWIRSRLALPRWHRPSLYEAVNESTAGAVERLFGNLARVARRHQVTVTVILIPAYHQVVRKAPFAFQQRLTKILLSLGYDVFDPREAYVAVSDHEDLFLPDLHFNARGNALLLERLLRHVTEQPMLARAEPAP
jgi:hypothetical protein